MRRPSQHAIPEVVGYVAAAALYIAIGLAFPGFLFSVVVAIAYLLVVVWLVPVAIRRLF